MLPDHPQFNHLCLRALSELLTHITLGGLRSFMPRNFVHVRRITAFRPSHGLSTAHFAPGCRGSFDVANCDSTCWIPYSGSFGFTSPAEFSMSRVGRFLHVQGHKFEQSDLQTGPIAHHREMVHNEYDSLDLHVGATT